MIKRFKDMDIINENNKNDISVNIVISKELLKECEELGSNNNKCTKKIVKAYIEDMIGYPQGMNYDYFSIWVTWVEDNLDTIDDIKDEYCD